MQQNDFAVSGCQIKHQTTVCFAS